MQCHSLYKSTTGKTAEKLEVLFCQTLVHFFSATGMEQETGARGDLFGSVVEWPHAVLHRSKNLQCCEEG